MQKIKSALTGHSSSDTASSTSGDRTSREYGNTSSATGATGDRVLDNNTGYSTTGNNRNTTSLTGDSGLTGHNNSATGHTHGSTGTSGVTGTSGLEGNRDSGVSNSSTGGSLNPTGQGNRFEETGANRSVVGSGVGDFAQKHSIGHDNSASAKFDPSAETTTHDHKHLQHVTQKNVRHLETEEVLREKEHERNIHHVQHHIQPVTDKVVNDEVHHEKIHPVTKVREQHVNTDEDKSLFAGLSAKHRDSETHGPTERTVVDLGEKVHETVRHHVHHVTQPVVQQEVQDRHRIHTVIPTQHVTHEAPIIHKSSLHEPIHMADFKKGGGILGSGITHENAGVLQTGECAREVDGVGEKLAQELHLKSGTTSHEHSGTTRI